MLTGIAWNGVGVLGFFIMWHLFIRTLKILHGQSKAKIFCSATMGFLSGFLGMFTVAYIWVHYDNIMDVAPLTDGFYALRFLIICFVMLSGAWLLGFSVARVFSRICHPVAVVYISLIVPAFFMCYPVFFGWVKVIWSGVFG